MKKSYSAVMPGSINSSLLNHLIRDDKQEDLCFALYNPSNGSDRFTGIIDKVIFPEDGDRNVHGNVSFNPCYYERVLKIAAERNKGIVFLHSHPCAGFQKMSSDDIKAEKQMARCCQICNRSSVTGFNNWQ